MRDNGRNTLAVNLEPVKVDDKLSKRKSFRRKLLKNWELYLFIAPAFFYFLIFHYVPMYGIQIAFKNFIPTKGILGSPWVGFDHFERFFQSHQFWNILKNTLLLSLYELALFLLGSSPLARLKYIEEGRIEDAIGNDAMRAALKSSGRPFYLKARLVSLPAYLPMLVLVAIFWSVTLLSFSGQLIVLFILIWLILSALLYAHLVVGQVYVLAEQAYQHWEYEQRMARRS